MKKTLTLGNIGSEKNLRDLERYLTIACYKVLKRCGKDQKWLRYALTKRETYVFSKEINMKQFEILEKVLDGAVKKFPKFCKSEIADILSKLVNKC